MNPQQVSIAIPEVILNVPATPKPDTRATQAKPDGPNGTPDGAKDGTGDNTQPFQPIRRLRLGVATAPDPARGNNVPMVTRQPGPPEVVKTSPPPNKPQPTGPQPIPLQAIPPQAARSSFRRRHALVLLSFLLMVVGPGALSGWYLWARAADQYASYMGFSVRTEDSTSSIASLLGPLNIGSGSTPDADILYEFIQSQDLVARIDAQLDLRGIWSKADPALDPVFAFSPPGTIEDLLEHWKRKVRVVYDSGNRLVELRVLAVTPEDARNIAEAILVESTTLINNLSALAREDAIGYARDELEKAVARLKEARQALTAFRNRTQIVDPTIDVQGQAGILYTLQQQLAEALISLDLLADTTLPGDPRIAQATRRIKVIEARIEDEKQKLGIGTGTAPNEAYATLVGVYESLVVDREFAERSYTAALAGYDGAQAEALRTTRYLATHIRPTLAEKAEYPERLTLLGLILLFAFLLWSMLVLVAYSLRDRR